MKDYMLSTGAHTTPQEGRCAMEWVAYIAGEPHSDHPQCVDPGLGAFGRSWNDALDDETRQKLRPYLARMIGTAGDGRSEERAWMCMDWLVRTQAPAWLDLAGLGEHAERLRMLPLILSAEVAVSAQPTIDAAGAAAGAAAWAAARDAAGAAADKALAPTRDRLIESALELYDRMVEGRAP